MLVNSLLKPFYALGLNTLIHKVVFMLNKQYKVYVTLIKQKLREYIRGFIFSKLSIE